MVHCSDEHMNRRALYGIAINLLSRYLDDEEEIIHDSGTSENPWAPQGALLSGIAETYVPCLIVRVEVPCLIV